MIFDFRDNGIEKKEQQERWRDNFKEILYHMYGKWK